MDNWIASKNEDTKFKLWSAGFTPSQLMDQYASGSYGIGQLADLYNTNTNADWDVSQRRVLVSPINVTRAKVSHNWEAAVIYILPEEECAEKTQLKATAEKLEFIKDVFGISLSHLAKILRTSRPSIYSWLEGEEPRENTAYRISEIHDYAERWNAMNPYHFPPGPLFRQPLGKSPSMLERLIKDDLNPEEIQTGLDAMLELMHRRRERIDRARNKTKDSTVSEKDSAYNRHSLTRTVSSPD